MKAFETFNNEGLPVLSLIFKCSFRLKPVEITTNNSPGQILDSHNNL